jgi:hypothetical protein
MNLFRQFKQNRQKERMVDLNVSDVVFDGTTGDAVVEVQIRYFEEPRYVVNTRVEKQTWDYHRFGGGWLLHDIERISKEESGKSSGGQKDSRGSMRGQEAR